MRLFCALLALAFACAPFGCAGKTDSSAVEHALNVPDDHYRTFYEIFVASYYDGNGDGTGDLNGVLQKLDYLNDGDPKTDGDLGVNGLWLMPIMPSPTYHKYDVTDYCSVDPAYGTPEDFQSLAAACHERGVRVILDLPLNHTSNRHPWFLKAAAYYAQLPDGAEPDFSACPEAGYYNFSREKAGASGWRRLGNTNWYYEGQFWEGMPDLALDNPLVREEIQKIAAFWLGLGADGFRLDAVKDYYTGSPDSNNDFLAWFNETVLAVNPDAILVGEAWEPNAVGLAAYYKSGLESFFDFPIAQATGSMAAVLREGSGEKLGAMLTRAETLYAAENPNFVGAPFLSNHDTTRLSAQYVNDADKMKLAAGILLTMRGSVFLYYGEEIGMNSQGKKDENKRLPMRWSATDAAGACNPPADADAVEQKFPALDEQANDPLSIYRYYKRAVRMRNENPELARGDTKQETALTQGALCAVSRTYGEHTILVLYNLGEEPAAVSLEGTAYADYRLYNALCVGEETAALSGGTLALPGYGVAVLRAR